MAANRKDTVKINGVDHQILYPHDSNSLVLKGESTYVLQEVEGQYVLERPQRRDLVANELLTLDEKGANLTEQDLLQYGFRKQA